MNVLQQIMNLFKSIDAKNTEDFLAFLHDDVHFKFGNADDVNGKQSVGTAVSGFFDSIKELKHDIIEVWQQETTVICRGNVTYTRLDAGTLTVPFANIFKFNDDLISDYLIYVDVSQLYNTA